MEIKYSDEYIDYKKFINWLIEHKDQKLEYACGEHKDIIYNMELRVDSICLFN